MKKLGSSPRKPLKVIGETIRLLDPGGLKSVDGAAVIESADCGTGSHSSCQTGCVNISI